MDVDYSGYKYFLFEKEGRTMTVTMNRPDQLNAMTWDMHEESSRIFYDLGMDHSIDVVILTGAGRAFSAGGDIVGMKMMYEDTEMFDRSINEAKKVVFGILDCDKVIIAKVNGDAVGLGATMALFCDIIFAADHARFGDPHVKVGLAAGDGGAVIWPQAIGYAKAKEYCSPAISSMRRTPRRWASSTTPCLPPNSTRASTPSPGKSAGAR